jgi:hypothetical protein
MKTQLSKPARTRQSYTELKPYYHRIRLQSSLASITKAGYRFSGNNHNGLSQFTIRQMASIRARR